MTKKHFYLNYIITLIPIFFFLSCTKDNFQKKTPKYEEHFKTQVLAQYESYNRELNLKKIKLNETNIEIQKKSGELWEHTKFTLKGINAPTTDYIREIEVKLNRLKENRDKIVAQFDPKNRILTDEEKRQEDRRTDIENGLFPKDMLTKMRMDIDFGLMEANAKNPTAGLSILMTQLHYAYMFGGPEAEQIQNILKEYLDSRGLVAAYVNTEPALFGRKFYTDPVTNLDTAMLLRRTINRALALEKFSNSPLVRQKAKDAIKMALTGDDYIHLGMNQTANELITSAKVMLDYISNDETLKYYKKSYLTSVAINNYNLNITPETFENYIIINYANVFSDNSKIQNNVNLNDCSKILIAQNLVKKDDSNEFLQELTKTALFSESTAHDLNSKISQLCSK